ncbi:hypothetical protein CRUP_035298, partial [Coryphaenoides rupestris]
FNQWRTDEDELAVSVLAQGLDQIRLRGSRVAGMQKQAAPAWQAPPHGRASAGEQGGNIRQKISQWEGRTQPAAVGKPHPPVVIRTLSADVLGNGLRGAGGGAGGGGGDPPRKASLCENKSLALDFRETQEPAGFKPVSRRSEPLQIRSPGIAAKKLELFQSCAPGISTSVLDKRPSLTPPLQSSPKVDLNATTPSVKQATILADDSCYTPSRWVPNVERPPTDDLDDNMPAGNFYTSRGFWRRMEGNKLLWEKGLGPSETSQPPPKPLRTFQYIEARGPAAFPGQGDGTSGGTASDNRGGRLARPPDFPPPPCPIDKTNGLSRHKKNRKSFEYEDAARMTVQKGMLGDSDGLYHAYSDDNIYEDIVCEGLAESPYEDVKLSPMCLPIGRARSRPATVSQRDNLRGTKPHTLGVYPAGAERKGTQQTLPPSISALQDTPKPASPRRSATQKAPRQPQPQAQ